jgi:hypothetical protein
MITTLAFIVVKSNIVVIDWLLAGLLLILVLAANQVVEVVVS